MPILTLFLGLLPLLILIGGIVVIVRIATHGEAGRSISSNSASSPFRAGLILIYAVTFAGLITFLYAISDLIGLALHETVFRAVSLTGADQVRTQLSYDLAALIVATPLGFGLWRLASRGIERNPEERQAPERRLFFAITFIVTSLVVLFNLQPGLRVLLSLPVSHGLGIIAEGVRAGILVAVYGLAWFLSARTALHERPSAAPDSFRDCALYVLSAFSLAFLAIGVLNAIGATINAIQGEAQTALLGNSPGDIGLLWANIVGWILAGGGIWLAVTRYDQDYPRVRSFRVPYLYLVLAAAVLTTLFSGIDLLYEVVRRVLGYSTAGEWNFLHDVVPPLLIGGAIWLYYGKVLRRQAILAQHAGSIPWPRRPYLAALTLIGLAIAVPSAVSLLWLPVEALFKTGTELSGGAWWRDQFSAGVSALPIGAAIWYGPWSELQRVAADPVERGSRARRGLLGAVTLVSSLIALGFLIALLWLLLRMLLGGPHDNQTVGTELEYAIAVVAAGLVAGLHGLVLRDDQRMGVFRRKVSLLALLAPDGANTVAELERAGYTVEILGYLHIDPRDVLDTAAIKRELQSLDSDVTNVLLVLGAHGGVLYPYSRKQRVVTVAAAAHEAAATAVSP